jgi:hypothetical protein
MQSPIPLGKDVSTDAQGSLNVIVMASGRSQSQEYPLWIVVYASPLDCSVSFCLHCGWAFGHLEVYISCTVPNNL